jgi:DNA-binding GntR family transcriptional regulator
LSRFQRFSDIDSNEKHRLQVGVDDDVPIGLGPLYGGFVDHDARVVHQNIQLADGVRHHLAGRRIVPGQRLVEADLSTTFKVSRNSVREGLQRLVAEGVVELLKHKGAAIRTLGFQDTMDVLDVAELMTGLLVRAAARNHTDAMRADMLRKSLGDLSRADEARDSLAFTLARRQFYRALLELARNRELRRLFPTIHMPIVYAQHRLPSLQQIRLRDYQRIAAAVLMGKEKDAEALGREHVQTVRKCIQQSYES